jgi:hypothetical protein
MRFMLIVKANRSTGSMPDQQLLAEMGSTTKNW